MRWPEWMGRISWATWGALVLLAIGAFAFIATVSPYQTPAPLGGGPSTITHFYGWLVNVAVTTLLAVAAISLFFVAFNRIGSVRFDATDADQRYSRAIGLLCAGAFLAVAMTVSASQLGLGGWIDSALETDWVENNFELPLIMLGLAIVLSGDWLGRSWVACDRNDEVRKAQINIYSITFASAVGVIVFIMIGSSAFSARLAQLQLERPAEDDRSPVAMERAQITVERILDVERRMNDLRRQDAEQIGLLADQRAITASFESDLEAMSRSAASITASLGQSYLGEQRGYTPWRQMQPSEVDALRERLTLELGALPPSIEAELTRAGDLAAEMRRINDDPQLVAARRETARIDSRIESIRIERSRNDLERECAMGQLGASLRPKDQPEAPATGEGKPEQAAAQGAATVVAPAPAPAGSGTTELSLNARAAGASLCPELTEPERREAEELVYVVRPLQRSWMADQMARRTPITLSIELVIVMGALGALLRMASERLLQVLTTYAPPQSSVSETDRAASRSAMIASYEGTLHTLGLQVVFGMATALALFILLNVTLNAASMDLGGERQSAESLNPFTVAGLGLLGGFSALNVAHWMGKLSEDMLSKAGGAKPPGQP